LGVILVNKSKQGKNRRNARKRLEESKAALRAALQGAGAQAKDRNRRWIEQLRSQLRDGS
jgi:hypothetical protein